MDFLVGHLDNKPNRNLIFKEKPNNIGIYIGNVANYNPVKGVYQKVTQLCYCRRPQTQAHIPGCRLTEPVLYI